MADGISITDLEQKVEVSDNDNFAVDNGTNTNKVTAKQIKAYMEPDFVKKAGDTMIGTLVFEKGIGIKFKKTDGSKYVLYVQADNVIKLFDETSNKGLYLPPEANYRPCYFDGTKGYALEYIKEKYSDGQGLWYRVWSDGWVEQGGVIKAGSNNTIIISFPKPFKDTSYFVSIPTLFYTGGLTGNAAYYALGAGWTSNTSFTTVALSQERRWYACGQGAE